MYTLSELEYIVAESGCYEFKVYELSYVRCGGVALLPWQLKIIINCDLADVEFPWDLRGREVSLERVFPTQRTGVYDKHWVLGSLPVACWKKMDVCTRKRESWVWILPKLPVDFFFSRQQAKYPVLWQTLSESSWLYHISNRGHMSWSAWYHLHEKSPLVVILKCACPYYFWCWFSTWIRRTRPTSPWSWWTPSTPTRTPRPCSTATAPARWTSTPSCRGGECLTCEPWGQTCLLYWWLAPSVAGFWPSANFCWSFLQGPILLTCSPGEVHEAS